MAVNRTYPVDWLLAAYNLVMALVWLLGAPGWTHGPALVTAHLAAAALPLLVARAGPPGPLLARVRALYPLAWLLAFWIEVDLVRRRLHHGAHDAFVLALEDGILGLHPHALWMPRMHDLWLSEILHFSYFAYYAALVIPILWLAARGTEARLMDAQLRMMAVFALCFLSFAAFPVDGPQHTAPLFQGPNAAGPFARLTGLVARGNAEALGAAFPSSHVAGAVTMAWIARLHLPRWAFLLLAAEAVGVFLSTFYTQQHYAIDSLAGVAVAVATQALLVPALLGARARWAAASRAPRRPSLPVPALPPASLATTVRREEATS